MEFRTFFEKATGFPPYPYQERLAMADAWPALLAVPTGLGKTAATVLGWCWRRRISEYREATPKRLIFCLPMRVLVEQVRDAAIKWLANLGCLAGDATFSFEGTEARLESFVPDHRRAGGIAVAMLLGGDVDDQWDLHPEKDALIVGTQDMLLSRALNRGYGMSRYRWPVHYGLLNNDCLWVMDEVQLMGPGRATTTQLQAFRRKVGTFGPARSLWMSATLEPDWLRTVDVDPDMDLSGQAVLEQDDLGHPTVRKLLDASKSLVKADVRMGDATGLTQEVLRSHRPGTLTIIVVNTVARSMELFKALEKAHSDERLVLIHSRFRPPERRAYLDALLSDPQETGTIAVTTQVVEAGVDVSCATLFTEVAPWPSLVQRFGRCNRRGEYPEARVVLIPLPEDLKATEKMALPYTVEDLRESERILDEVIDVQSAKLPLAPMHAANGAVVRRRDVFDLFDTTPDLCGSDIDVSPFIRDVDEVDVQFYWRIFDGHAPSSATVPAQRNELCRVSISAAGDFLRRLEKKRAKLAGGRAADRERALCLRAFNWDTLEGEWTVTRRVRPGQTVLLHPIAGGYDPSMGWTGEVLPKTAVTEAFVEPDVLEESDRMGGDPDTASASWISLTDHLQHVSEKAHTLAVALDLPEAIQESILTAAHWHDLGKAHSDFQERLIGPVREDPVAAPPGEGLWAKSGHRRRLVHMQRPHFRHELASALAWLTHAGKMGSQDVDLVAYLIACHHGKVRLSIRSLPGEPAPPEPGRLFARGLWQDDTIPIVELPNGTLVGPFAVDLSPMQLGVGSWLDRMLTLRDAPNLGPFRLGLLEAIVRIADWRASAEEEQDTHHA